MGRRTKTSDIIENFLVSIVFGGVFTLSMMAPNSLVALEKPLMRFLNGKDKRREAKRISRYLKQQKLVTVEENQDGSYHIAVSQKGKKRASKAYFEKLTVPDIKWDTKWRIVMFDIPEKHKPTRDYISNHLKRIGFKQLQKSVFVFPYPIDAFMAILDNIFPELAPYIIYMTVDETPIHNKLIYQFSTIII